MGKNAHPTDQFRRQQRAQEIKKTRDVAAAKKDPTLIKAKLDKIEQKEKDGKNPKYIEEKKRRLQDLYAASLKRAKEAPADEAEPEQTAAPKQTVPGGPAQPFPPQASVYYHPTLNPFGTPPPGAPQMYHPAYTMNLALPPGLAPPPGFAMHMPPHRPAAPPINFPHSAVPPPYPHPQLYIRPPVALHAPVPPPSMAPAAAPAPVGEPLTDEAKKELDDMMESLAELPPKPEELEPPPPPSVPLHVPQPPPPSHVAAPPPIHQPPPPPPMPQTCGPPHHVAYPPQQAYPPQFYGNLPPGAPQMRGARLGPGMAGPPGMRPKQAMDPFAMSSRSTPIAAQPPPSAPAPVATPPPAPERPVSVAISADVTAMIPAALRRAPPKAAAKPRAASALKPAAPVAAAPKPAAAIPAPSTDNAYDEFMANMKALGAM